MGMDTGSREESGGLPLLPEAHIFRVVDLALHVLVQSAVDGEGIGRRIVAVEVVPQ